MLRPPRLKKRKKKNAFQTLVGAAFQTCTRFGALGRAFVAPLAALAPVGRVLGLPTALFRTLTTLQSASRTRRCRTSSSANVLLMAAWSKNTIKPTVFSLFLLSRFQRNVVLSGTFAEPFGGPKAIFGGSLGSLGAPGWPKTGPKEPGTPQDRPKTAPRRPKTAPRRPQDGPLGGPPPHPSHQTSPGGPTVAKIRSKLLKFQLKFG